MANGFKEKPILITGCARSGTSMTAGIVHLCGAWGGQLAGPNDNNKKGMFENLEIRNGVVKPYFRALGVDPLGQKPLPDITKFFGLSERQGENWKQKIFSVIDKQGYAGQKWFYKGAKACLFWPLWDKAFPKAKWIIVRRNDEDIINSCLKTGFMRAYNTADGWRKWVEEHKRRFFEMKKYLNVVEVWPEKMVNGDFSEIQEVIISYGLEWNENAPAFVSPTLWGGKNGKSNR